MSEMSAAWIAVWERSEEATIDVARSTQAAVLQIAEWAHKTTPPRARRLLVTRWLGWVGSDVEQPTTLATRPHAFVQRLVGLHGEFIQRLLEFAEDETPRTIGPDPQMAQVLDLETIRRGRTAGR